MKEELDPLVRGALIGAIIAVVVTIAFLIVHWTHEEKAYQRYKDCATRCELNNGWYIDRDEGVCVCRSLSDHSVFYVLKPYGQVVK